MAQSQLFLAKQHMETDCTLCPRGCHANRLTQTGYCSASSKIFAARAALHFWEEPCISGQSGSGAVFFSGCNLKCVFCQNHDIALNAVGKEISVQKLVQIFFELQDKGAVNINLVTPTPYIPLIAEAIEQAKADGFSLPFVYNTGSYETVEALRLLDGLIDIYLPDFKYLSPELSLRLSNAPDYAQIAKCAIAEMYRQVKGPVFSQDGLMKRGVIVRHLVLPGQTKDSKKIIRYLYETYHNEIYISIMNQYTPLKYIQENPFYADINRTLTDNEYTRVIRFAEMLGVENGFIQQGETAKESFIPSFHYEGL